MNTKMSQNILVFAKGLIVNIWFILAKRSTSFMSKKIRKIRYFIQITASRNFPSWVLDPSSSDFLKKERSWIKWATFFGRKVLRLAFLLSKETNFLAMIWEFFKGEGTLLVFILKGLFFFWLFLNLLLSSFWLLASFSKLSSWTTSLRLLFASRNSRWNSKKWSEEAFFMILADFKNRRFSGRCFSGGGFMIMLCFGWKERTNWNCFNIFQRKTFSLIDISQFLG